MNAHSSIAHLPSTAASSSHRSTKSQHGDAELFADQLDGKRTPPAQAARAALEERPDLAGRAFGAIVSLLARNQELPAPVDSGPAMPPAADEPADVAEDSEPPTAL